MANEPLELNHSSLPELDNRPELARHQGAAADNASKLNCKLKWRIRADVHEAVREVLVEVQQPKKEDKSYGGGSFVRAQLTR